MSNKITREEADKGIPYCWVCGEKYPQYVAKVQEGRNIFSWSLCGICIKPDEETKKYDYVVLSFKKVMNEK